MRSLSSRKPTQTAIATSEQSETFIAPSHDVLQGLTTISAVAGVAQRLARRVACSSVDFAENCQNMWDPCAIPGFLVANSNTHL